jgi:hypothetical protein
MRNMPIFGSYPAHKFRLALLFILVILVSSWLFDVIESAASDTAEAVTWRPLDQLEQNDLSDELAKISASGLLGRVAATSVTQESGAALAQEALSSHSALDTAFGYQWVAVVADIQGLTVGLLDSSGDLKRVRVGDTLATGEHIRAVERQILTIEKDDVLKTLRLYPMPQASQ